MWEQQHLQEAACSGCCSWQLVQPSSMCMGPDPMLVAGNKLRQSILHGQPAHCGLARTALSFAFLAEAPPPWPLQLLCAPLAAEHQAASAVLLADCSVFLHPAGLSWSATSRCPSG